ncbi:hypothetical protein BGX27_008343 [Mortierella sp. AM989]|nr:hypothetical protein BGX27_008343 [Mortierella sp. AM989]
MRLTTSVAIVASLMALSANNVQAWGVVGHTLTGQIAQEFLTPTTTAKVDTILAYYGGLLSNASVWADKIKFLSQYKWATPLHYFNPPNDNPPDHCDADYVYNGQDSVNAIFNMTSTLKTFQKTPPTTVADKRKQEDALKFFVHIVGDVHQPLHDSTRLRGGNDAPVKWGRTTSNLHSMWDTLIITKDIKERFENDPQAYLDDTLKLAKTHWKDSSAWSVCDPAKIEKTPWSDVADTIKTLCPIEWAAAANALDCSYVWVDYSATRDYSTDYFKNVTGPASDYLVQLQLAKAGVRMAAILNEIYDPSASAPLTKRRSVARLPSVY